MGIDILRYLVLIFDPKGGVGGGVSFFSSHFMFLRVLCYFQGGCKNCFCGVSF